MLQSLCLVRVSLFPLCVLRVEPRRRRRECLARALLSQAGDNDSVTRVLITRVSPRGCDGVPRLPMRVLCLFIQELLCNLSEVVVYVSDVMSDGSVFSHKCWMKRWDPRHHRLGRCAFDRCIMCCCCFVCFASDWSGDER